MGVFLNFPPKIFVFLQVHFTRCCKSQVLITAIAVTVISSDKDLVDQMFFVNPYSLYRRTLDGKTAGHLYGNFMEEQTSLVY